MLDTPRRLGGDSILRLGQQKGPRRRPGLSQQEPWGRTLERLSDSPAAERNVSRGNLLARMRPAALAEPASKPISHARCVAKPPSGLPCFIGVSPPAILGFGVSPCASDRCRFAAGAPERRHQGGGPAWAWDGPPLPRLDWPHPLISNNPCKKYVGPKNSRGAGDICGFPSSR